jgi:phosphate-selective porin OprO and OprP
MIMPKLIRTAVLMGAPALVLAASLVPAEANGGGQEPLEQRLEAMQAEIEELKAQQAAAPAAKTVKDENCVKFKWGPAPAFQSCDGLFEMKVRGRIHADAAWIEDDAGFADTARTQFRRSRIGVQGKAFRDFKYLAEVDFAGNAVSLADVTISWARAGTGVTLGHFKVPVSLEELTSSNYITFIERASFTEAFTTGRQFGAKVSYSGKAGNLAYGIAAGAFRGGAATNPSALTSEGSTFATRVHVAPKLEDVTFHLGGSVRFRDDGSIAGAGGVPFGRYRARPSSSRMAPFRHVDTGGAIIADDDFMFGLEAAAIWGPLTVQGEYNRLDANLNPAGAALFGSGDPAFEGWYADISWFIWGGERSYSSASGTFGRPKVSAPVHEGGAGAWQLSYRYDSLDLSDAGVPGGEQTTHLIGLNWYPNRYMRLMLNYGRSHIEGSFVAPQNVNGENDVDVAAIRAQIDW